MLAGCSDDDPDAQAEEELLQSLEETTTTLPPGEEGLQAEATFTVTLGDASGEYEYTQSELVASTLTGTSDVPVQLHASDPDDPLRELTISGAVEVGQDQPTSPTLALGLNVELDDTVVALNSLAGECVLTVERLDQTSMAGSFVCASIYAEEDLTAQGTFSAG